MKKKLKTKLFKSWQPDEEYFWGNNADKHQMTNYGENRSWCEHQLHGFKMYWCKDMGGSGKPMISWDLTYWNRCKVLWEDVDKRRMYLEMDKKEEINKYVNRFVEAHIQKHKPSRPLPMSSAKRLEFADYIRGWRNGDI